MADAEPQAVERILIAQLRNDVAQPVVTAMAAALLELGDARRQIEFVVRHRISSGLMRKNPASAATAWPLRFM